MIRRLGNIILSVIFLSATAGLVVNKHYSNGQLYSASIYSTAESCCSEGQHEDSCHNESEILKISSSLHHSGYETLKLCCVAKTIKTEDEGILSPNFTSITKDLNRPELPRYTIPLQKLLQVFLI
jgi:hypothetical protein